MRRLFCMSCGMELIEVSDTLVCPSCNTEYKSQIISIYETETQRVETYKVVTFLKATMALRGTNDVRRRMP